MSLNRREFLRRLAAATGTIVLGSWSGCATSDATKSSTQKARGQTKWRWVLGELVSINSGYHGVFADIARTPEGHLVSVSGEAMRAPPADETWVLEVNRSTDLGQTWSDVSRTRLPKTKGRESFRAGLTALRSGRLLATYMERNPDYGAGWKVTRVGEKTRGRPIWRVTQTKGIYGHMGTLYSDDGGQTWNVGKPISVWPYAFTTNPIIEEADGTLVRMFEGIAREGHQVYCGWSAGLVRSHDGGLTWGDPSVIAEFDPATSVAPNEPSIAVLPDGRWVCVMRLDVFEWDVDSPVICGRAFSSDRGRTWTPPDSIFVGQEPALTLLPGGVLFCGLLSWVGRGVYWLSYDDGRSWTSPSTPYDYWNTGSPRAVVLNEDTVFVVFNHPREGHLWGRWLKREIAES